MLLYESRTLYVQGEMLGYSSKVQIFIKGLIPFLVDVSRGHPDPKHIFCSCPGL